MLKKSHLSERKSLKANNRHSILKPNGGVGSDSYAFFHSEIDMQFLSWKLLTAVFIASTSCVSVFAQQRLDIRDVKPDLTIPNLTEGKPTAGCRVKCFPKFENQELYHVLYLPTDWKRGGKYPVVVEWAGNGNYKNRFGDVSNGTPEGSKLGYGLTSGAGCIWLCLPYLNNNGTQNVTQWWGDAPTFDPQPTVEYAKNTIASVCKEFGGDLTRIVLTGFSRGAIACNYLGLYDDDIATTWAGFVCYSHYDGVQQWPFPKSDSAAALARLKRLGARPQFICAENSLARTKAYLRQTGIDGHWTFASTGFRNHSDAWILRPSACRDELRAWFDTFGPSR